MDSVASDKVMEVLVLVDEARYIKNVLGKPKKAIELCNHILQIDPWNRNALLIKAGALHQRCRMQEALALIEQIIEKWPNHWEAYYLAAMNCFGLNKDKEALELINESLEHDENFDNVITKAQILCLMKQDYEEWVKRARSIDKKRADNFMKNHFTKNMNVIKPSLKELLKAKIMLRKRA